MNDHNLLNSASFNDMQKSFTVSVQPFIREGRGVLELGGDENILWITKIEWEYRYIDVGVPRARRTPVKPIEIAVADVWPSVPGQTTSRPLPAVTEPHPVRARIPFRVINTNLDNNHKLEVEFFLTGVLVKPRPGCPALPLKKQKAYVMMDSTSRGKLAMEEAAADQLEETLSKLGLGSLRDSLPGGLSALTALPPPLQSAVLQGLIAKGELPELANMAPMLMGGHNTSGGAPLALPEVDSGKEESAFMGDFIVICPDECQELLKTSYLKAISREMVEKGWRRV